jgi:uroporphyrinogen decarboxylase
MDLVLNPALVEELLERITEIQVTLARRFVALGVDGGYFGDDYGAQKNLLLSPKMWRVLFKPRLARMFAVFREAGLPVVLHSDGDIAEILPDLVEIGLTVLNPVQPEALDHAWLKRTFGAHLAFYGGVSTQTVLPFGTPAEVQAAVETCVQMLAADGTALVIGPSHRLMTDIPLENVDALLTTFAGLGESE